MLCRRNYYSLLNKVAKPLARMMVSNNGFPDETAILLHQTAGHMHIHGKLQTGMLKHKAGHVLKPVQDDERGNREIKFYETVFDPLNVNPVHLELRKIIPQFLGLHQFDHNGRMKFFIKLEDVAQGCEKPCVMDVKIGRKTYDPDASPKKIASENAKYAGTKEPLGFCIPGIWIHQVSTGQILKLDKEYGRSLTPAALKDALRLYLNGTTEDRTGRGVNQALVVAFLQQLYAIRVWFQNQNEFLFYATSLLLVYDATIFESCELGGTKSAFSEIPYHNEQSLIPQDSCRPTVAFSPSAVQNNPPNLCDPVDNTDSVARLVASKADCLNLQKINAGPGSELRYGVEANDSTNLGSFRPDLVRVRMIDFAHVYPARAERDDNYIEGLENFIRLFEGFLL